MYWVSKEGVFKLNQLETDHLFNILNLVNKKHNEISMLRSGSKYALPEYKIMGYTPIRWISAIKKELVSRQKKLAKKVKDESKSTTTTSSS